MTQIPQEIFQQLLPRAALWAQRQEAVILLHGAALAPEAIKIAQRAGVRNPELIRVFAVRRIPAPEEADLRDAAAAFDLITADTGGLTIGHGIFVREDCVRDLKLVAHELMHVAQYERHGSILAFLQQYLSEVNQYGYPAAPMEQEAINFAETIFPTRR